VERDDLSEPELGLAVERGLDQEAKIKYYLSNAAPQVPLLTLVQVGPTRWPVEVFHDVEKNDCAEEARHFETAERLAACLGC
jgi:hypothetical protein